MDEKALKIIDYYVMEIVFGGGGNAPSEESVRDMQVRGAKFSINKIQEIRKRNLARIRFYEGAVQGKG